MPRCGVLFSSRRKVGRGSPRSKGFRTGKTPISSARKGVFGTQPARREHPAAGFLLPFARESAIIEAVRKFIE